MTLNKVEGIDSRTQFLLMLDVDASKTLGHPSRRVATRSEGPGPAHARRLLVHTTQTVQWHITFSLSDELQFLTSVVNRHTVITSRLKPDQRGLDKRHIQR